MSSLGVAPWLPSHMSSQHRRFYNSPVSGVAKYISWIPMEIRGRSIVASRYGIRTRIPYTLLQLCTHTPWLVCTAVFPAVSTRGRSGECILLAQPYRLLRYFVTGSTGSTVWTGGAIRSNRDIPGRCSYYGCARSCMRDGGTQLTCSCCRVTSRRRRVA